MAHLRNRRVLLGVTGGIAAYKAVDLVRRLRTDGAEVRVALTANAARFVTALSFQAVSGHRVHEHLLDADAESGMGHIELARWADLVLIAPASAGFLARLAHGMADDLLATVCLATEAPIVVAPAMNRQMWLNPFTRSNLERLAHHGVRVLGPGEGDQACGETGPGRLLEPAEIVAALSPTEGAGSLAGLHVVVTAGPTWEAIDPVRGITNHSSGKMGFAVAAAARDAGARVTVIAGPATAPLPTGVRNVAVRSAEQMLAAALAASADADIFIGVAAVADYRPLTPAPAKIKKDTERLTLELVRNPDVLATVAARPNAPFCVGFAAETDDVIANARRKLLSKRLQLVAANRVGVEGSGFGGDDNALVLVDRGGIRELEPGPKHRLARELIEEIATRYHAERTTEDSRPAHRD